MAKIGIEITQAGLLSGQLGNLYMVYITDDSHENRDTDLVISANEGADGNISVIAGDQTIENTDSKREQDSREDRDIIYLNIPEEDVDDIWNDMKMLAEAVALSDIDYDSNNGPNSNTVMLFILQTLGIETELPDAQDLNGVNQDEIAVIGNAVFNHDYLNASEFGKTSTDYLGLIGAISDRVFGGITSDNITADSNDKYINAGAGNDIVTGNNIDNTIIGGSGDDVLAGEQGHDLLMGGSDDDLYRYFLGDGNDTIIESNETSLDIIEIILSNGSLDKPIRARDNTGNDLVLEIVSGGVLSTITIKDHWDGKAVEKLVVKNNIGDTPLGEYHLLQLNGHVPSYWPFSMDGGAGMDSLLGSTGSDYINTRGDDYFLSTYSDTISGDAGNDTIIAGEGNDYIRGNFGNDEIHGHGGNDIIYGHEGNDSIFGGNGDDFIVGENDWDVSTNYNSENDYIDAGTGHDRVSGCDGDDIIYGGAGIDSLFGGNGNDSVFGGEDRDIIHGNAGADHIVGGLASDIIFGDDDNDIIYGDIVNDKNIGSADIIHGGNGNDTIFGGAGDDWIVGQNGDDHITAGRGRDIMSGDAGSDSFYFESGDGYNVVNGLNDGNDNIYITGVSFADAVAERWNAALVLKWEADDLTIKINNVFNSSFDHNVNTVNWNIGIQISGVDYEILDIISAKGPGKFTKEYVRASGQAFVDDTLSSDGGSDVLIGGNGNDTYVYHKGKGGFIIEDIEHNSWNYDGVNDLELHPAIDRIVFHDTNPNEVYIYQFIDDYIVDIGEDKIRIRSEAADGPVKDKAVGIEEFVFHYTSDQGNAVTETFTLADYKANPYFNDTGLSWKEPWATGRSDGIVIEGSQADHGYRLYEGKVQLYTGPNVGWIDVPSEVRFDAVTITGNTATGNDWKNYIRGYWEADTLIGKGDDDLLQGHEGGDTYVIYNGDGNDIINDFNNDAAFGTSGDDVIYFKDLTRQDADNWDFVRDHDNHLWILMNNDQSIKVDNQFHSINDIDNDQNWGIETLRFMDGSSYSIDDFV